MSFKSWFFSLVFFSFFLSYTSFGASKSWEFNPSKASISPRYFGIAEKDSLEIEKVLKEDFEDGEWEYDNLCELKSMVSGDLEPYYIMIKQVATDLEMKEALKILEEYKKKLKEEKLKFEIIIKRYWIRVG